VPSPTPRLTSLPSVHSGDTHGHPRSAIDPRRAREAGRGWAVALGHHSGRLPKLRQTARCRTGCPSWSGSHLFRAAAAALECGALHRFPVSCRTSLVGGVLGRQQTCSPSFSLLLTLVAGHRGNGIHVVLVELGYLRRATGVPSAAGDSPPNPFPFVPFTRFVAVPLFGRCASFPQARRPRMDNRDRLPEARSVAVRGFARCIPDLAVRGSGTAWRGHC